MSDFLRARPEMLIERHREGRIVEGHGDLRPEHVCLEREPKIIDCLEFSRRLRLVDPADELAFLALECAMLDQPGAGERLQRSYETIAGDRPPAPLIAWYTGCRALLRARLSALHSREPGARPPEAWLAQAKRYLDAGLGYTDDAVLRQAEPAQPLERLLAVQPADRFGEKRRDVEHGEARFHRLRLQSEGRHRVGDDQPLELRAGHAYARPRR